MGMTLFDTLHVVTSSRFFLVLKDVASCSCRCRRGWGTHHSKWILLQCSSAVVVDRMAWESTRERKCETTRDYDSALYECTPPPVIKQKPRSKPQQVCMLYYVFLALLLLTILHSIRHENTVWLLINGLVIGSPSLLLSSYLSDFVTVSKYKMDGETDQMGRAPGMSWRMKRGLSDIVEGASLRRLDHYSMIFMIFMMCPSFYLVVVAVVLNLSGLSLKSRVCMYVCRGRERVTQDPPGPSCISFLVRERERETRWITKFILSSGFN